MECDSRLIQVKGALEGFDGGSISSYVSEANTAFSSLGSCFGSVGDTLSGAGIWQDVVATSFGLNIESIKSSMESLKSIPPSVEGVSGMVSGLVSTIESYENTVESYNSMESQYNNLNVGSRPSKKEGETNSSYNSRLSAYNRAVNEKNQLKLRMDKAKEEAETLKGDSYSQLNAIDGMMGGSGSFAPAAGGGGAGGSYKTRSETDEDGNTKNITEWYDDDGKKVSEDYNIVDKDGDEVERGKIVYRDDGSSTKTYDSRITGEHGVKEEYDSKGVMRVKDVEEREIPMNYNNVGGKETNIHEEYDENGKMRVRNIEKQEYSNGNIFTNVRCKFDENEEMRSSDVEKVETADGCKKYNQHIEYNEEGNRTSADVEKIENSDGSKETAIHYSYDEKGNLTSTDAEKIEKANGTVETIVHTEYSENGFKETRTIEKVETSSGVVSTNVLETWSGNKVIYKDTEKKILANGTEVINEHIDYEGPGYVIEREKEILKDGCVLSDIRTEYDSQDKAKTQSVGKEELDGNTSINIKREFENGFVTKSTIERVDKKDGGSAYNVTKTYEDGKLKEKHIDSEDVNGMGIDIKYDATTTYFEDGTKVETIGSHANRGDSIKNETIEYDKDGNVTNYYQEENQHNDFSKDTGVNVHFDENGQYESVDIESRTGKDKGLLGQDVEVKNIHKEYEDGEMIHEEKDVIEGQIFGTDIITHKEEDSKNI